ncbi:MAG TPA: hypothetical protein VFI31_06410 [Pirellulales bacterium]|nr:hypothetical protein [Pirellulales bacterium]
MTAVLLALSIWFFSMSDPFSPYTLMTIPLGVIFFFAALGAVFGQPDRGARTGLGMLVTFLGILAVTKNGTISLAITVAVALAVCAFILWRRRQVHGP